MKTLLLTILLLSCGQAQAYISFNTGSKLLENCEAYVNDTNVAKGAACTGYVAGIADTHASFTLWKRMDKEWCEPENAHTEAP